MDETNFLLMKTDLAGISSYLEEKQGIKLSEQEHKQINTIFDACDIYDDENRKEGKDSKLNLLELRNFYNKLKTEMPKFQQSIQDFISNINKNQIEGNCEQQITPRDATYVAQLISEKDAIIEENNKQELVKDTSTSLSEPKPLNAKSSVKTDYEWSEEKFAKVLDQMLNAPRYKGKFKHSVLQGKTKAFIESGKKYNIDPRFLVAISMCESERGISKKALELNNVGGLKINGKYHKFETVEASIDSIAKTISTRCEEGYSTPTSVANSGKYCQKYAANEWLSNVKSYLRFFDKYYE